MSSVDNIHICNQLGKYQHKGLTILNVSSFPAASKARTSMIHQSPGPQTRQRQAGTTHPHGLVHMFQPGIKCSKSHVHQNRVYFPPPPGYTNASLQDLPRGPTMGGSNSTGTHSPAELATKSQRNCVFGMLQTRTPTSYACVNFTNQLAVS